MQDERSTGTGSMVIFTPGAPILPVPFSTCDPALPAPCPPSLFHGNFKELVQETEFGGRTGRDGGSGAAAKAEDEAAAFRRQKDGRRHAGRRHLAAGVHALPPKLDALAPGEHRLAGRLPRRQPGMSFGFRFLIYIFL